MNRSIRAFTAAALAALVLSGCGEPAYATFEEYVGRNPEVLEQIQTTASEMHMRIAVEGNTVTYEYKLDIATDESNYDAVAEQLEAGAIDANASLNEIKEQLQSQTGIENITLVLSYLDSNGVPVYTISY